jgi:hypothetical protein
MYAYDSVRREEEEKVGSNARGERGLREGEGHVRTNALGGREDRASDSFFLNTWSWGAERALEPRSARWPRWLGLAVANWAGWPGRQFFFSETLKRTKTH